MTNPIVAPWGTHDARTLAAILAIALAVGGDHRRVLLRMFQAGGHVVLNTSLMPAWETFCTVSAIRSVDRIGDAIRLDRAE